MNDDPLDGYSMYPSAEQLEARAHRAGWRAGLLAGFALGVALMVLVEILR